MTNGKKELEASSCQKDAVDVLVVAGRVLGGGGHLEGAQEARDERLQLVHVLLLRLHHPEHKADSQTEIISFQPANIEPEIKLYWEASET